MLARLAPPESGYEIVGCIRGHSDAASEAGDGLKVLGSMEDFAWTVKTVKPDVLVAAMEERRAALPIDSILECKLQGVEVDDWPTFYEKLTTKLLVSHLRPSWLVFSDGFKRSRIDDLLKRGADIAVATILGLAALPVCLIAAVLIKLDSRGPVFFRQERVGKAGRVFTLVKFRTMRQHAERETGPVWAQARDPRVTRVGRLLRETRVDEIPQFLNVLLGDMSLVGPRPERPTFVVELSEQLPFYMYRHVVKPGITGWAQVRYRYGSTLEDSREKLEYDLYYVKNRSLFLDLLIIIQTVQVVLFGRGWR
jgi:sugar transferase (PEP-CTERM system associated)